MQLKFKKHRRNFNRTYRASNAETTGLWYALMVILAMSWCWPFAALVVGHLPQPAEAQQIQNAVMTADPIDQVDRPLASIVAAPTLEPTASPPIRAPVPPKPVRLRPMMKL